MGSGRILVRPAALRTVVKGDHLDRFLGLGLALSAALLLSACEIERTPPRYYSHRVPAETEIALAEEELRARVGAFGQALERGDPDAALLALAPAPELYLVGPGAEEVAAGPAGAAELLGALFGEEPPALEVREVRVTLGPRARVAWVAGFLRVRDPAGGEDGLLRITGVYLRVRGEWRLVQAHLSRPPTPPAEAPPGSPPDSLAPEDA